MARKYKQFKLLDLVSVSTSKIGPFDGEKKYIATGDIDTNRIASGQQVSYSNRPSRAALLLKEGEVLFAKMRGTVKVLIGTKDTEELIFSTGFYVLIPGNKLDKRFLYFFLLSSAFNQQKDTYSHGATMAGLGNGGLQKIKIMLPVDANGEPDLSEQERTASILEDAHLLLEKRVEADRMTADLVPSIFADTFSKAKYEQVRLGDFITHITSGARGWASYYTSSPGYKYIRIQNVRNARLSFNDVQYVSPPQSAESSRIKVEEGDLLVSITADLGRTAVVDAETASEGAYINQHIALIRLTKEFNPIYVAYYLELEGKIQFLKYGQAAAKKGLNFDSIKSLRIPKVPIELQNEFVEKIRNIYLLQLQQEQSGLKIRSLSSNLLAETFSQV